MKTRIFTILSLTLFLTRPSIADTQAIEQHREEVVGYYTLLSLAGLGTAVGCLAKADRLKNRMEEMKGRGESIESLDKRRDNFRDLALVATGLGVIALGVRHNYIVAHYNEGRMGLKYQKKF